MFIIVKLTSMWSFLLFVQICLSKRGMTVLGQGGVPLQVVHVGRRMHYALLLVEVDGEWGARDFVMLILRGDRRHRQVHPRRWTRHSTSTTRIIRRRYIRSCLYFIRVISIMRDRSITRGMALSFTRGISLSSLLNLSMSMLLSNIMLSLLSSNMQRLL